MLLDQSPPLLFVVVPDGAEVGPELFGVPQPSVEFPAGDVQPVPVCRELAKALTGPRVNLAGRTSLLGLAAVSSAADVFLSGDTGPMHLAAAVGTRVVAVFTCTSPARARPYGDGHRIVATRVSCAASYLKTCSTLHCLLELSPDRVWPALSAALSEAVERRQAG